LFSLWGSSKADVFAVGAVHDANANLDHPLAAHYDGTSWSRMTLPGDNYTLADVFGISSRDVYAVGVNVQSTRSTGQILHYDGSQWTPVIIGYPGQSNLKGVWASSPSDVFAVGLVDQGSGLSGGVLHYDGHTWSPMTVPAAGDLLEVWGTSGSDVFAVGHDAILHYDGKAWIKIVDREGLDVWGSSSTDVFVVASGGTILHGTP
jgi:hypothetical protein